jgi:hypothetical protein
LWLAPAVGCSRQHPAPWWQASASLLRLAALLTVALTASCTQLHQQLPAVALDASHLTDHQSHIPHKEHVAANQAASQARATLLSLRAKWPAGYVALCTVVKDQRRDLRYWVEYWK